MTVRNFKTKDQGYRIVRRDGKQEDTSVHSDSMLFYPIPDEIFKMLSLEDFYRAVLATERFTAMAHGHLFSLQSPSQKLHFVREYVANTMRVHCPYKADQRPEQRSVISAIICADLNEVL